MIMNIGIEHYLILAILLFFIGIYGIFCAKKNIIGILIAIELMLLAVNINFIAFSAYNKNLDGQVMSLFIMTVAAAEAAIGLAILICYYRNCGNIKIESAAQLKG